MTTHTIALPWLTPPLKSNDRRGWQAQHRVFQQTLTEARWAIRAATNRSIDPVPCGDALAQYRITLHWRIPDRHTRDSSGMAPTYKAVEDALVQEGVLVDDSWQYVPAATCEIHPPIPKLPAVMWLSLEAIPIEGADDAA